MEFNFFEKFRRDGEGDSKNKNLNLDTKVTRNIEQSNVEQYGEKMKFESRLNKEEALVYQDYASTAEAAPFSEKASPEAYAEAEMLLARLREKEFDWLGIDWKKIDLRDAHQYDELEKRLDVAVRQIAESGKDKKLGKFVTGLGKTVIPLATTVWLLLTPSIGSTAEKSVGKNVELQEKTDSKWDFKLYMPYVDFEKGTFNWKALLEPAALAVSKEKTIDKDVSFKIPYEYARLFDTGKPLSEEDYKKINDYIKGEILKQLESSIYAFDFDKETFKGDYPDYIKKMELEVDKVSIIGVASPEATNRESELPGNIDQENIDLSKLRATDSLERIEVALKDLGIKYSPKDIKIDGIENQFSAPEVEALIKIAQDQGGNMDVYDLIKSYNTGKIIDKKTIESLDSIVGSKRKVIVHLNMKDGSQKVLIIPIPFLLIGTIPLIDFIRRRRRKEATGTPENPISETIFEPIPDGEKSTDVISDLDPEKSEDVYIDEILKDVFANYEIYDGIAEEYAKYDLSDEHKAVNALTHEILIKWMEIDQEKREKLGLPAEDYYKRESQKVYALLHAVVARRLAMLKQEKKDLSDVNEFANEITKIIKEEIEKVVSSRKQN